ncbi:bifunctional phosphatase PAP2/diacylglycerol kinase family protein [Amycolatopsis thermophila]|uniref:Undecaprenyl-diphosphatase n=1 Tax=Amycolatopsis thermophila TaxID=206084 RepID=A0ABU0ELM3_9PSEU|nr:bifunctional phosphatase PAP2/diacylglycerol kinase family protein [Amycolatopsis thermophila]MDQ0376127.1 undecaprenyl-diphosphatase [Amycolatopsis thermophila]
MRRWVSRADRQLFARVAATDSVLLDRVLPRLGRSANYGGLWWAVSGTLAATRNRRARRAALRGMLALGIASATANGLSKRVIRRARPSTVGIPPVRQLRRAPWTTSFPSGHSASAAAFTAGVALEWPALAAPVGALAAGVATSRVVTGAHYPSDVLAGIGLGFGAAAITLSWWPRTPAGPARAEPHPAPALPTGEGLVLVVNPSAGSANAAVLDRVGNELPQAKIVELDDGEDLEDALTEAARTCRVLGVAGGDGTINAAARTAADHDVPLLVLPAGTLNHFARDLGVETPDDAITALRKGAAVRIDLGSVDSQVFVNTCSTGLYTDLVRYREKWEKRIGKWPAMLVGLVHVLRRAKPQDLVVNGEPRKVWMIFAGNGAYRPRGFAPTYRRSLDDGLLDIRTVYAERPWARTRLVLAVLTGTLRWCTPYQDRPAAPQLTVRAPSGRLDLALDGEVTHVPPDVTLRKRRGALVVYR